MDIKLIIEEEKTPSRKIRVVSQRPWIRLEDGHVVTQHVYNKILKHAIKVVEKHVVYKIQGTVYFVMRGSQPE